MKKTLLFAGILLAVSAAVASAAGPGLNMSWGAFCPTAAVGPTADQTDPCDGTSGATYSLIGTVISPIALQNCVAEDWFIDIQENAAALSDFWKLEALNQPGYANAAGCRGDNFQPGNVGSMQAGVATANFPTTFTGCAKFWGSTPAGGVNYGVLIPDAYPGITLPNRARYIGHFAKSPGSLLSANFQYGAFGATFDTNHANGVDALFGPPTYLCAGCSDQVCLVFNEIILYQASPAPNETITNESTRRWVTWQGPVAGSPCPGATPTHKATWGQVKSLYR